MNNSEQNPQSCQTAVIGCPSVCRGRVSAVSCRVGCAVGVFLFFQKEGKKKNEVLISRERASSFASFGLSVGFVRLANVLACVMVILQSLPKFLQ